MLVLFSFVTNSWKLTDFGLTAPATSRRRHTTRGRRGTACYRAPELLAKTATYTRKVDIWGLGCILFELVMWRPTFNQDWEVEDYYENRVLQLNISWLPEFWQHHVIEVIKQLLHRISSNRPSASELSTLFASYFEILDSRVGVVVSTARSYPTFAQWRNMIQTSAIESDLLSNLVPLWRQMGDPAVTLLLQSMSRMYQIQDAGSTTPQILISDLTAVKSLNLPVGEETGGTTEQGNLSDEARDMLLNTPVDKEVHGTGGEITHSSELIGPKLNPPFDKETEGTTGEIYLFGGSGSGQLNKHESRMRMNPLMGDQITIEGEAIVSVRREIFEPNTTVTRRSQGFVKIARMLAIKGFREFDMYVR